MELEVWCDGSGTTAGRPAGIGVACLQPASTVWVCVAESVGLGTNNYAELKAIERALALFPRDIKLLIRSDSAYAIGSVTLPWKAEANKELIESIRAELALRKGNVRFEHCDGHAGVVGNEMADALAKVGRKYGQPGT